MFFGSVQIISCLDSQSKFHYISAAILEDLGVWETLAPKNNDFSRISQRENKSGQIILTSPQAGLWAQRLLSRLVYKVN